MCKQIVCMADFADAVHDKRTPVLVWSSGRLGLFKGRVDCQEQEYRAEACNAPCSAGTGAASGAYLPISFACIEEERTSLTSVRCERSTSRHCDICDSLL